MAKGLGAVKKLVILRSSMSVAVLIAAAWVGTQNFVDRNLMDFGGGPPGIFTALRGAPQARPFVPFVGAILRAPIRAVGRPFAEPVGRPVADTLFPEVIAPQGPLLSYQVDPSSIVPPPGLDRTLPNFLPQPRPFSPGPLPDPGIGDRFVPNRPSSSAVPEPATWLMALLGLFFIGGQLRRSSVPRSQMSI